MKYNINTIQHTFFSASGTFFHFSVLYLGILSAHVLLALNNTFCSKWDRWMSWLILYMLAEALPGMR